MNNYNQFNNSGQRKAKEINLREIFLVIKSRFWIIVVITALTGIVGFIQSNSKSVPLYSSSTNIIIGADEESRKTLQVIVRDSAILDKVIKEMDLKTTAEALAGQITVSSVESSQVVNISVTDKNPILAAKIADTTAQVFRGEVPNIVDKDYVRILSKAKVKPTPINQGNNLNKLIIAIAGGLVIGIGLAFFIESLDDRIRSVQEIETFLGLPVLGRVPKTSSRNMKRKVNHTNLEINIRGETVDYK
ncbi:Wzz/FepE/Etk N-terminal domain-containing protein [Neobacillus niacini]|uniref:YveK family protein n=1 Tax=Neobacillus niacini TaxID=86668 RepID=UPI00285737AA|nr:Wzz/FepE/Etk N-terminal domain-containing protein [Neobacillus niacini]MDR7000594.1 capsular polysaccharide biosynthesis protein [Neobacillus niacini]